MVDDTKWSIPHYPVDYEWYDSKPNPRYCQHKWLDTGMRLTFCKKCDAKGKLDPMSGEVTLIPDEEPNTNITKGQE